MAHVRKQLRDAVKTALAADYPGKVGGLRAFARARADLPAIEISTPSEVAGRVSDDGDLERRIGLEARIVFATTAPAQDVEDEIDVIAADVERAVYGVSAAAPFSASVLGFETALDLGDPAEARPAALIITFSVLLLTTEDDPETIDG